MGAKILVVDDEPEIRAVLGECLAAAGFEARVAGAGAEAVAAVQTERPAVILLMSPRLGS